jgi:endonuclease YncB( thermonuclease family)
MTLFATCFLATVLATPAQPAEPTPALPTVSEVYASDVIITILAIVGEALYAIDGDTIVVRSRELIAYSAPAAPPSEETPPEKSLAKVAREEFSDTLTVRLIGVDTPEKGAEGAKAATKFTRKWLKKNSRLMLMMGAPVFGYFGRVLAVVLPEPIEGTVPFDESLNCRLLFEGLAEPVTHFENTLLPLVGPCMEPLEVE